MNEVVLQFDNESYQELTRLQGIMGYGSNDEVLAHLVELGYNFYTGQDTEVNPVRGMQPGEMRGNETWPAWVDPARDVPMNAPESVLGTAERFSF